MPDGPIFHGAAWPIDLHAATNLVERAREALHRGDPVAAGPVVALLAAAVNEIAGLRKKVGERVRRRGEED